MGRRTTLQVVLVGNAFLRGRIIPHCNDIISNKRDKVVDILGLLVNPLTMEELLLLVDQCIVCHEQLLLGVVNVAKLVNCCRNVELRKSLTEADIVLADGLQIVWLSKLIGSPLPQRVAGIDIMYKLLELSSKKNHRVYFLGAKREVVQKVVEIAQKQYPDIRIAGYRDGYFSKDQEQSVAEDIRNSHTDILFVGISSPKKENFLRNWRNFMDVSICHGVGGSFDILAGVTNRAPIWMQKCGLEWLFRLIQEPRRMWRRYLVTNTIFIILSFKAILRARFSKLFRKSAYVTTSNAKNQNK